MESIVEKMKRLLEEKRRLLDRERRLLERLYDAKAGVCGERVSDEEVVELCLFRRSLFPDATPSSPNGSPAPDRRRPKAWNRNARRW